MPRHERHFVEPPRQALERIMEEYESFVAHPFFQRVCQDMAIKSGDAMRKTADRGRSDREIHEAQAERETWLRAMNLPHTLMGDLEAHYGEEQRIYEAQLAAERAEAEGAGDEDRDSDDSAAEQDESWGADSGF